MRRYKYLKIDFLQTCLSFAPVVLGELLFEASPFSVQRDIRKNATTVASRRIYFYLSKQRSTLSDISSNMHNCSSAISCISRSSPIPLFSHSNNVSGSGSAIWNGEKIRLIRKNTRFRISRSRGLQSAQDDCMFFSVIRLSLLSIRFILEFIIRENSKNSYTVLS